MKKDKKIIKLKRSLIWIIAFIAVFPIDIIGLSNLVNTGSFGETLLWGFKNISAFFLQYTLLLFLCALVYALTRRLWASYSLCGLVYLALSLISHYKTVINGAPLVLRDLTLTSRFFDVFSFALPQIKFSLPILASILVFLLTAVLLFLADRHIGKLRLLRPIMGIASATIILVLFCTPILPFWANSLEKENMSDESRVRDFGAPLGLYMSYVASKAEMAALASASFDELEAQVASLPDDIKEPDVKPNVIFLMSESFFDVTKLDGVTFSDDPVPNFHALAEKYTSGEFISNTYCGGTGYVEMEVLTGICSNLLRESETLTSLSPNSVYEGIPTIADVFDSYGYRTGFLHSYNSNLYNREAIYSAFGFDDILFEDSFNADVEMRGGYISDMALSEKIISMYEEKGDESMFLFALSMENHQPYTAEKFDHKKIKIESDILSEDEISVLSGYVNGLYDADRALMRLIEYFSASDEETMIVFFGDHLPNLGVGEGETVYSRLSYSSTPVTTDWAPDELAKMLSTDYLIWTNYEKEAEDDVLTSSNMLGLSVLKRLGFSLGKYYGWLDKFIAPYTLIYRPRLYVDASGMAFSDIPDAHSEIISNYKLAIYDIVYGKGNVFGISRGREEK